MFSLSDLPYAANSLEPHIDAQTMEIHHGKHHATYVKNLNEVLPDKEEKDLEDVLRHLDKLPEEIRTKVRNNGGGHFNHSLFWQMMTPGGSKLEGQLLDAINSKFGSVEGFQEKFSAGGIGRFGSGWIWLTGELEIIDTPNQDNPILDGKNVILGLDVWEHAYYLRYQNRRADYIAAWWNVVNWKFVASRLD
ncbi:MAG: superoxide dismutase [bacterium]|nr:superoxide dismutase [bacterium]